MPRFEDHECLLSRQEEDIVKQFIDSGMFITARRRFRSMCMINRSHPETSRFFKSNCACRNEEIRHLVHNYYMVHPFSKLNLYWEFFIFCLLLTQYQIIPLASHGTNLDTNKKVYVVRFSLDIIQMADMFKLFCTGYYDPEKSRVVLSFYQVAKKYLLTYFFIDLLSCIHFFLFTAELFRVSIPSDVMFSMRILNRLKIFRMPRCLNIIELFREYMAYSSYLFKGIKVVFIFLVVIFWAFSINFFIQTYVDMFVTQDVSSSDSVSENEIFETYYNATLMLLLVSYGSSNITEILEYLNEIFFMSFGFGLQLFVYAQILQVWTKYASAENKHHSLHKQFKEYMKYKELPLSLRDRIFSYFQFKFHKHFFKESDINNMVSPLLKQEILMHVTRNHIERVEFFKHLPENILMKVVAQLKSEIFLPGDVIISAGTIGTSMFFIYHGTVAVYTPTGKEICHLEDGAHFGEIALILSETRVATVVAVTASELFMLRRSDFLAATEPFPEFRDQLIALATERLHRTILQSDEEH